MFSLEMIKKYYKKVVNVDNIPMFFPVYNSNLINFANIKI